MTPIWQAGSEYRLAMSVPTVSFTSAVNLMFLPCHQSTSNPDGM